MPSVTATASALSGNSFGIFELDCDLDRTGTTG
ncbi:hypothetical protein NK6_5163 [Bradyrhizobium diazoefficiens]|uniref:Uncharacterized protein n=1 Tax=Bradyrhizobium diazoefficiens TaxID=1355477 RepID=A0A0E4FZ02_9BRAD|nr:hypothetical protein NK6_5163 [Bradyrhizobium diazoefficiens]